MPPLWGMLLAIGAQEGAAPPPPRESFVEAPGPAGPLKGTMLMPERTAKAPILLILPGSGPTDRDGDSPLGVRARSSRLLAEALAARGIGSVRVDKRGLFASAAAIPDPNEVTIADYAADVHGWASAIRARTGASCVWVLGHSEGGLVALAAAQAPADLCGVVLVATPGRRLGEVLRGQLRASPGAATLLPQAMAAIDALEAGRPVDTAAMPPGLRPLFRPAVQPYLIDVFAYDPAKLAAAARPPMLIVQGDRDIQVSTADAEALHAAQPRATLAVLPGVNHVLKVVPSADRAANVATYADPSLPIAPGVVDAVARFVTAR